MPVDHYENFPVASLLLPPAIRTPVETIYRFARSADDIADEGDASAAERLARLGEFRAALDAIERGGDPADPRFPELATIIRRHALPIPLFRDLIDAFEQDIGTHRYADFPTLLDYCRRSANPIGRLLLHLVDTTSAAAIECSDRICSALQLINFLQDVAIDWKKQRVYLPQEDLRRFSIAETQIAAGQWTRDWAALMGFQIDRTRRLMLDGAPLLSLLHGRMRWEIRATVNGGLRILDRLKQVHGDVFNRRPTLATADWLWIASRTLRGHPA